MSGAGGDSLEIETVVAAPADAVWRALADDERRLSWWSYLELDVRPGGRLIERWHGGGGRARTTSGEVVEARAPHHLRCTWRDDDWPAETQVELTLRAEPGGTRVRVLHTGWRRLGARGARLLPAHADGWRRHLENLKRFVERELEMR